MMDVFNNRLFEKKTALITGGAGGIGAGVARCFASLGATVLLQDIDAAGLERMRAELVSAPGGVGVFSGDLSKPGVADAVFDDALRAHKRIDFLINNAGRSSAAATLEITEAATQELIELKAFSSSPSASSPMRSSAAAADRSSRFPRPPAWSVSSGAPSTAPRNSR
jgi:NAD(P)-dependent dehydrogenase (short-subunit alcohol dehydrogenase family)